MSIGYFREKEGNQTVFDADKIEVSDISKVDPTILSVDINKTLSLKSYAEGMLLTLHKLEFGNVLARVRATITNNSSQPKHAHLSLSSAYQNNHQYKPEFIYPDIDYVLPNTSVDIIIVFKGLNSDLQKATFMIGSDSVSTPVNVTWLLLPPNKVQK